MLDVQSLSARRGNRRIFCDIGFSLKGGDALAITGANGSGKSSLLRCLAGLLDYDGTITWNNQPLATAHDDHTPFCHLIGHLDALKPDMTAHEMLDYWRLLYGSTAPASPSDPFAITDFEQKPIRFLSAGQRRRVSLTRLICGQAPLWLLDEPTTALDAAATALLFSAIATHRARGGIVIIATHQMLDLPTLQHIRIGGAA